MVFLLEFQDKHEVVVTNLKLVHKFQEKLEKHHYQRGEQAKTKIYQCRRSLIIYQHRTFMYMLMITTTVSLITFLLRIV